MDSQSDKKKHGLFGHPSLRQIDIVILWMGWLWICPKIDRYRDLTKSCLSHSFRFPACERNIKKSCLPHCERKRQNNPFQIRTFHFHPFFSSLCLRFTVSSLPTFFPKQVYLYGVLWVAKAPLHRKRPRQFVSSYSFERVAVLGRIILLLSPGLHSWHALRLRSGCSGPPGYTMLYTRLPLVSTCVPLVSYSPAFRMMCLVCLNSTHPAALDRQRQETTTKQRGRPAAANIHQQHLPKEESKRKARAPTKDTKEQPKQGREGERTRKSKPGKTRSKTRSKRDANEIRALAAANSRKVKSEGWITWRRSLHGITHWRSTSRQNPAGTDSNRRGQNHTEPKYDKFQWARLSRNYWQWHHDKDCNQYHTGLYK